MLPTPERGPQQRHFTSLRRRIRGGVTSTSARESGKRGGEGGRARERDREREEGARSSVWLIKQNARRLCLIYGGILPHDERTFQLPLRAELRPGAVEPGRALRGHGRGPAADGARRHRWLRDRTGVWVQESQTEEKKREVGITCKNNTPNGLISGAICCVLLLNVGMRCCYHLHVFMGPVSRLSEAGFRLCVYLAYVQTFDCQLGGKRVSQQFHFRLCLWHIWSTDGNDM